MNSAYGGNIRDLESKLVYHHPSTSPIADEKGSPKVEAADKMCKKMARLQHCIFALLLLFSLLSLGTVAATVSKHSKDASRRMFAEDRFQKLLDSVDPDALHNVLLESMKDKYQHGVWKEVKTAVKAIHQKNPKAAESLIELAKRQATGSGNGTVVVTSTADTAVTSVPSSSPLASTPTTSSSDSQATTTPPFSQVPTSVPVTPESSSIPTIPASTAVTSTSSPGSTSEPVSSSESTAVSNSPTPTSQASTPQSSDSESQSGTKTTGSTSRTTIYTTTKADGGLTTVTSVTVVPAGQADQTTDGSSPTKTSGRNASLQSGGGGRLDVGLSAVLGGAVMIVMGAL